MYTLFLLIPLCWVMAGGFLYNRCWGLNLADLNDPKLLAFTLVWLALGAAVKVGLLVLFARQNAETKAQVKEALTALDQTPGMETDEPPPPCDQRSAELLEAALFYLAVTPTK